jgi:hypothetical protein
MFIQHRVSQIIELFGYKYRLHQVILGKQGESSCYISVIKGKSCIFREYNRIDGQVHCGDISCTPFERKDDIRVRYIKLDYRIYLFK